MLSLEAQKSDRAETQPAGRGHLPLATRLDEFGEADAGGTLGELAEDLAKGERPFGGRRDPGADTDKSGSRRLGPEGIGLRRRREQHQGHALQLVQDGQGVGAIDVAQRVEARGATVAGERIEQENPLSGLGPEAGGGGVVLPLDVENHHRIRPAQQVGDHHAHALAGARGRVEHDVFRPVSDEEVAAVAAQQDASPGAEAGALLF